MLYRRASSAGLDGRDKPGHDEERSHCTHLHFGCHTTAFNARRRSMDPFLTEIEQTITRWHGISAPNEPARRMAADLIETIRAFEAMRGTLVFEDEPSSFEAALHDLREV
jgi:hypothetical protein